jgi:hypothetical protein
MTLKLKKKINWKRRLWKVFSEYIRRRDQGKCFTCDTQKPWQEMDAAHYVPASVCPPALYFDERNVNCGCTSCNRYKHGNLSVYAYRLAVKHGPEILGELEAKKRVGGKWNEWTYQTKVEEYKSKIKELEARGK